MQTYIITAQCHSNANRTTQPKTIRAKNFQEAISEFIINTGLLQSEIRELDIIREP